MVTGEHEVPLTGAYTNQKAHYRNNRLIYTRIFTALGITASLAIFSLYLESFGLSDSSIGFIFSISSIMTLFVHFFSTSILERFTKTSIFITSASAMIIAYILMGLSNSLTVFLIGFYAIFIFHTIKNLSFEILFRDHIKIKNFSKQEGRLMALRNIGAATGPLITGVLLYLYADFSLVFLLSAGAFIIALTIFWQTHVQPKIKRRKKLDDNVFENLRSYVANKKLYLPYAMAMGTSIWWMFIHVYIPLFIINAGLNASTVGWFIAAVLLPLILLESHVGASAHKYGFRTFFMFGFGGLFISCAILFFIEEIFVQLGILILCSVFAAFLGPNIHPYFFKQIRKKEEEKYYPIFGTSFNIGSFAGKFGIAWVLLYAASDYTYLVMAAMMALFFILAWNIPKNQR